MKEKRTV